MADSDAGCVFCAIAAGESEASHLHADERVIAFMDIRPVTEGHLLVIPRRHCASLATLDADDGAELFRVAQQLAASLRTSGLRCEGVNLFLADGEAAGQEVFHVHLHVVPRYRGDGFGLRMPPDYRIRSRAELDAAAARIRAARSGRH
jgi:histidine triad (HIT) family protein